MNIGSNSPDDEAKPEGIPNGAWSEIYTRKPIGYRHDIPVFSELDEYTANYERIAMDHLSVSDATGKNPFIDEESWRDAETSTVDLVRKYSTNGNLILDVGVGLGRLLSNFDTLQRFGMDISPAYLQKAKEQGIEVCLSRIEDMPYREGIFNIIVCTDVLEHVLDLNLCIQKILQSLKYGGYLIVRVPYREDLSAYADPLFPYRWAHIRSFDEFSLSLLFRNVFSMEVVEFVTVGRTLDWPRMVYRLPIGNRSFAKLVRLIKRRLPTIGNALSIRLFTPVEINMVIRKPATNR